jgi:hypothetical protein
MILDCQIRCPNIIKGGIVEYVYIKKRYIVTKNPSFFNCGDIMLYHDYEDVFDLVCLQTEIKSSKTKKLLYKVELELDTLKYYE